MKPLFLRALAGEPVERFPVWMMRQAGRYLPGYMAIRSKTSFLDLCRTPELAAEVTLEPIERFGMDASIVFADILLTADAMGIEVEFPNGGPKIVKPVRSPDDVTRVHAPDDARVKPVYETISILRRALPASTALLGFSAAPFTLCAYMIEGGTSRDFELTRRFAHREPAAFRTLMERTADALAVYLKAQAEAGADALQLFDTWGGIVSPEIYREVVLPAIQRVIEGLGPNRPPVLLLPGLGTEARLEDAATLDVDALSLDWRADLASAYAKVGDKVRLQGNLDPTILLAEPETIVRRTNEMLEKVPAGKGHLTNLGHGILKDTPPEHAKVFIDTAQAFRPKGAA